jgi:putative nucleotidyltransferase with HDIG domain
MVYENERIVDANERIDKDIYQKLYSLEVSLVEQSRREGGFLFRFAFIGKMMMVAAILAMFGLYLYSFRKKIFNNNKKILLINLLLLIGIIMASIITNGLNWSVYLIPTTIVSMLLAILIDSGIAFVGTVVLGLILGTVQGGGLEITLLTVVIGMISIYSVHLIITRNQIFKTIIYIAVAYLWLIVALNSLRFDSIDEFLRIYMYQLLPNAILSPFITFMILGVFERMFDITTDVTLLELSDLNHPLLKRLSMEAPGTFHHSMIVGNLSEAAAKAIGANSLLARVGSYYHDIGKMEKPEYFVENQLDADNRHSRLTPNMSALILASHVRNGIEMARRHGIPKRIRDFIPEHHGTNIMKYFYNKALELSEDKQVNEADFRYPGPKPQTRETGIVMLADAVEAATRTLSAPTPGKIRSFVEDLVDQRFREGELDECELTFRELKQIVDAFMVVLQGVFQHRIEYPDQERKPARNNKKEPTGEIRNLSAAKEPKIKNSKA